MDGIYDTSLYVVNSGTETDWITFKADECATPILEGPGSGPTVDEQSGGVGSAEAEYLRFEGIVVRGWNIGFGNGWAGGVDSEEESNGHWDIEHCISYSNGRTGFTFFSAENFTLKHSISAHNGSSQVHSWSSGVTLFEAHGTNLVEGNISFENTDAERNTDGSGFIADEASNDATFINNVAFGNGGSCLRLTDSSGTRFINNTCYHNSQLGSRATGPSNPSEIYFTNAGVTVQGVTFMNNVIVGTGQAPAGATPIVNQPGTGWSNNVVETGNVAFFTDAAGTNPNFIPAGGDGTLTGQGSSGNGAPSDDIGFDPKCIVKRTPQMVGDVATESWWQYDVDIEYIQSIGGVAGCFNPATRGTNDIGAYLAADVSTIEPGSCIPPEPEEPPGVGGAGGAGGTTSVGGTSAGGASGTDGMAMGGTTNLGGASVGGAATTTSTTGVDGSTTTAGTTGPGQSSVGGSTAVDGLAGGSSVGGTGAGVDAGAGTPVAATGEEAGCGCRLAGAVEARDSLRAVAFFALGLILLGRRRR
jgi:parallel beta-helix repeat protein